MKSKTILILGGYGNTGRPLSRLLLEGSDAQLILAGRNISKARQYADELNSIYTGNRVRGVYADASDTASLRAAFEGANLIVMASSTTQYTSPVVMAALEARADYLDIQYSSQKISLLRSMSDAIKQAGRCFITDGGFHPGLPAFLVRYTAQSFESLVSARVCSVIKEDWKSLEVADSTIYELMELVNDFDMSIYKAGQWKRIGLISTSDYVSMDFRGEFGRQYCAPMLLEEMRALPDLYPTLQDTGFYVGGFNWFTDWVILPLAMISVRMWPNQSLQPMAKLMHWGLRTFSKPPFGTLLKIEAHGEKAGRSITSEITISHPDGYMFTAIPVAACIFQVLDGIIGAPGLWLQALVVDPNRFMSDMQRMGIRVNKTNGGADEMEPG